MVHLKVAGRESCEITLDIPRFNTIRGNFKAMTNSTDLPLPLLVWAFFFFPTILNISENI